MARLPFLKFYPNDWLAEPTVRVCSVAARGLWIDMLSLMHLSPRRGYLLAATGSPISPEHLARLTGCSADEVTRLLAELSSSGTCSCTDDGTIYSRRMVRDEGKREKCSEAGQRGGGNPNFRSDAKKPPTFKGVCKGGPKGGPKGQSKPPEARGQRPDSDTSYRTPDDLKRSVPPNPEPTNHQLAIEVFCNAWQARYGAKYPFNGGKDGASISWLLKQLDADLGRLRDVVGRFLADTDPFISEQRHPVGLLRSQLPRWLVAVPAAGAKPVLTMNDFVAKHAGGVS